MTEDTRFLAAQVNAALDRQTSALRETLDGMRMAQREQTRGMIALGSLGLVILAGLAGVQVWSGVAPASITLPVSTAAAGE